MWTFAYDTMILLQNTIKLIERYGEVEFDHTDNLDAFLIAVKDSEGNDLPIIRMKQCS